jgi:hypothetical protein
MIYVADSKGNDHVLFIPVSKNQLNSILSVTSNALSVSNGSYYEIYYGPYTLNTITGGQVGQLITLLVRNSSVTLTNGAGGAGQFILPGSANLVVTIGGTVTLR